MTNATRQKAMRERRKAKIAAMETALQHIADGEQPAHLIAQSALAKVHFGDTQ